jgi:hypothetical protein
MCRNIKTLFNFDPSVTAEEIRAASLQFVRKISDFNKPSNPQALRREVDGLQLLHRLREAIEAIAEDMLAEDGTAVAALG